MHFLFLFLLDTANERVDYSLPVKPVCESWLVRACVCVCFCSVCILECCVDTVARAHRQLQERQCITVCETDREPERSFFSNVLQIVAKKEMEHWELKQEVKGLILSWVRYSGWWDIWNVIVLLARQTTSILFWGQDGKKTYLYNGCKR